ncbi:Alpha/Beta hydrolase protein [Infundibulicybe gibba]|nr:Alpha/Beta hydrolase protein [Infundibulicybe gibba]
MFATLTTPPVIIPYIWVGSGNVDTRSTGHMHMPALPRRYRIRTSTKLFIPHPTVPGCDIVGILEQLRGVPARNLNQEHRRIALKRLALRLPCDSFRFDFRGNHETPGTWRQGALTDDIDDLNAVVAYLKSRHGYTIDLVVGHSRGSLVAFRWLCTSEEAKHVRGFVNASGRYRMRKILDSAAVKIWRDSFEKQGYHTWSVSVARKLATVKIYPEDLEMFTSWDTSLVWDKFPPAIDVLTLHGLSDQTVPPYDALIYARALSQRDSGTHSLCMMEGADHNFSGRQDDVVDTVLRWWAARQRGEIRTGVWMDDSLRGKL